MATRLLLCFSLVFSCWAQQPAAQPSAAQQPIRAEVNEVVVPVTVTDEKGRFVSNLEQQDFQILDEGQPQTIRYFTRERSQPVVIGFLLDVSNASRTQWKNFQQAAEEMVLQMLPGNKKSAGYLISYNSEAELRVNTTPDAEKIVEMVEKLKPAGGAALYDAVYMACTSRLTVQGEPADPRRVIVIIGDGNDNSSKKTLEEVLELAQRNQVTIFGLSTTSYGFSSDGDGVLHRLAEETGGRVVYPLQDVYKKEVAGFLSNPTDEGNFAYQPGTGGFASAIANSVLKAVLEISGEVTTQYILHYFPDVDKADPKKQFRNLEIKVALANVTVRARKGYFPFAP